MSDNPNLLDEAPYGNVTTDYHFDLQNGQIVVVQHDTLDDYNDADWDADVDGRI